MRPYLLVTIVLLSAGLPAFGDTLTFTDTYALMTLGYPATATFTLDSSQLPSAVGPASFYFYNVPVTVNGTTYVQEVGFGDATDTNNVTIYGLDIGIGIDFNGGLISKTGGIVFEPFLTSGALFTGSVTNPTFQLGTFTDPYESDILTITSSTPEPSSIFLLCTGLLGGFVGARRRCAWNASKRFRVPQ